MTDETADSDRPPAEEEGPDEFPTPAELPDESVSRDEVSPFDVDPSDFDDLNDFAAAEWEETTTARERVRAIIRRTASPQTAGDVADVANVSPTTARTELNDLADQGIVLAEDTSNGKVYRRDPDWYLMQRVQELSQSDSLLDHIHDLKQELNDYRDEFETETPEEAIVSDRALSTEELQDVSKWRSAEQDLTFLRAAYRFREARECSVGDTRGAPANDTRVSPL